jgi:hypothetical protein
MFGRALALAALVAIVVALPHDPEFDAWARAHAKTYTPEEYPLRAAIFHANVAKINAHNAAGHTWKMVRGWMRCDGCVRTHMSCVALTRVGVRAAVGAACQDVAPLPFVVAAPPLSAFSPRL